MIAQIARIRAEPAISVGACGREVCNTPVRAGMMSGDTSSAMRAFGPEANVHIVSKPIDSDALLRLLSELLFD